MPTVITNNHTNILKSLLAIRMASEKDKNINQSIIGIHLEGPYISPLDGPRGAHQERFVKPPDWQEFMEWQNAAGGMISIITLSPEWENSVEFIQKCTSHGVLVSIGHTSATPEQIDRAVKAGACMSTHLGNGADLMLKRHPNYIWEQLASEELAASMIADGFHLPDSVIKVILKMKGKKTILVSDSVSLAGMPPGEYSLHIGGNVILTDQGRLCMRDNPELLAGSAQSQLWGVNHLLYKQICSLDEALDLASINPSERLGFPQQAGISEGAPADFILFHLTSGNRIEILETFKRGIRVYQNKEAFV